MELLQNYRVRKQLGLCEKPPHNEALEDMINERLHESLREVFWLEPLFPQSGVQRSARSSMLKPSEPRSPRHRLRSQSFSNQSVRELMSMIEGLEARVDFLETRNQEISQSFEESQSELNSLRDMNAKIKAENEHFLSQVSSLKAVISSESSAGKVLERVRHTDHLEFKLEIYKQQISVLNDEISKLRNRS